MHVLGDKVVNPNRLLLSKAVLQALRSNKRFPKPLNVCFTQHRTFPPWGRRRRVSFIVPVSSSKRKCPCRFGLDTVEDLALLSLSWLQSKDRLLDTQGKRKKNRLCSENCLFFEACFTQDALHRLQDLPSTCGHSWLLRTRTVKWPQSPFASQWFPVSASCKYGLTVFRCYWRCCIFLLWRFCHVQWTTEKVFIHPEKNEFPGQIESPFTHFFRLSAALGNRRC